jgi:cytochrome c oxidase subunit 1
LTHTILTYGVMYPSFVTAFTIIASLEIAGRMKGAKGLFNWIGRLPWSDPFFASCALAMIAFTFGGFGGAINAAYAMNSMVHNTAWIMAHFHVTLGTTVAMTFMGTTYWLLPRIAGRELRFPALAIAQPYLWFFGMLLFSASYHIAGLRGLPRRVYSATLTGEYSRWHHLSLIAAAGASVLFISAMCFVTVATATWLFGKKIQAPAFEFAVPLRAPVVSIWDRFGLWTAVAALLVAAAYAYPIIHLLAHHRYGSPPYQPF